MSTMRHNSSRLDDWQSRVDDVFDAVRIRDAHAIECFDERLDIPQEQQQPYVEMGENAGESPVQSPIGQTILADWLYARAYSHQLSAKAPPQPKTPEEFQPDQKLIAELSRANTSAERWESGWHIARVLPRGQVLVLRGATRRRIWAGEFVSEDGPGTPPRPGARVRLYHARESTSLQDGLYFAFGNAPYDAGEASTARVYFNLPAKHSPQMLNALTSLLNRFEVPFRFKCLVIPTQRTDSSVLYTPRRLFPFVSHLLAQLRRDIKLDSLLDADTPLFAKELAPGMAGADDPLTGESFGQQRCRIIAAALWNAFSQQDDSRGTRWRELRRLLAQESINPELPHLNARAIDCYQLRESLRGTSVGGAA